MTADTWAWVEYFQAIWDFVVWWILAPFVGCMIAIAILVSVLEEKNR